MISLQRVFLDAVADLVSEPSKIDCPLDHQPIRDCATDDIGDIPMLDDDGTSEFEAVLFVGEMLLNPELCCGS